MAFPNYICFGNFSELLVILFATSMGCDISQGFFFKKSLWIKHWTSMDKSHLIMKYGKQKRIFIISNANYSNL